MSKKRWKTEKNILQKLTKERVFKYSHINIYLLHIETYILNHIFRVKSNRQMPQELSLSQISHKTYAIHLSGLPPEVLPSLLHILKSHRGIWNPVIKRYEIPISRTESFLAEISQAHPKIIKKDVPVGLIKGVLSHRSSQKDDKKVVYILPKQKWNRMLVLDPLFFKKYEFLNTFIQGQSSYFKDSLKIQNITPKTSPPSFKRCLIVTWNEMLPCWKTNFFQRYKLTFKPVDYQSLSPDYLYKIRSILLKEHQFQYLTYEQMVQIGIHGLHRQVLTKYHSVICDDCDVWMFERDALAGMYGGVKKEVKGVVSKILSEVGNEKDMIIFLSSLDFRRIDDLLDVLSILKPYNFGIDPLIIAKGEANDATWMKKRYGKNSKNIRQLIYLLSSTVFTNIFIRNNQNPQTNTPSSGNFINFYDMWTGIPFSEEQMYKLKALDSRHRSVNKKTLLSSLQTHRTIGSQMLSNSDDAKYLKELREAITIQKMKDIFKWIYHLVEEKGIKLAVVVENTWGLDLLQKFLKEQQLSYIIYQIKYEEIKQNPGYNKFNLSKTKVCLLVRDKLLVQYKSACIEREKEWQMGQQHIVQEELGLERGGIFELAKYKRPQNYSEYVGLGLKAQEPLSLQKITTVKHIVFVDVFWHDFSVVKEQIMQNVFDWKISGYEQTRVNQMRALNEDGMITNWKDFFTTKTADIVRHFWVVKESYEQSILQKYLINFQFFEEEEFVAKDLRQKEAADSLKNFWEQVLKEQQKPLKDLEKIEGIYDIDEQFDKLEYEALMQQKKIEKDEKEGKVQDDDKPVYNTTIEGLVVQTPRIDQLKQKTNKKISNLNNIEIELKNDDGKIEIKDISWLESSKDDISAESSEEESQEDVSEQSKESNINKYLIVPKQQSKVEENNGKMSRNSQNNAGQKDQEQKDRKKIYIPSKKMKVQSSFQEQRHEKSKKIFISPPPTLVTIRKNPEYTPIQTVLKHLEALPQKQSFSAVESSFHRRQNQTYTSKVDRSRLKKGSLWHQSQSKQKIIAKMKKVLKVKLVPLKSSITYP